MHQKAGHRPGHNGAYSSYQHLFVLESLGRTGRKPLPVWDRDADCNPNDALSNLSLFRFLSCIYNLKWGYPF